MNTRRPRFSHLRRPVAARLVACAVALAGFSACRKPEPPAPSAANSAAPVTLRVATDGEFLAFQPTELTCRARQRVTLIFAHAGRRIPQQHNWVLVLPDTADAVDRDALAAGASSGWLPRDDARVLAATELCAPGQESVISFVAPRPGDYPFLCTFPGHGAEMRGVLHVAP